MSRKTMELSIRQTLRKNHNSLLLLNLLVQSQAHNQSNNNNSYNNRRTHWKRWLSRRKSECVKFANFKTMKISSCSGKLGKSTVWTLGWMGTKTARSMSMITTNNALLISARIVSLWWDRVNHRLLSEIVKTVCSCWHANNSECVTVTTLNSCCIPTQTLWSNRARKSSSATTNTFTQSSWPNSTLANCLYSTINGLISLILHLIENLANSTILCNTTIVLNLQSNAQFLTKLLREYKKSVGKPSKVWMVRTIISFIFHA